MHMLETTLSLVMANQYAMASVGHSQMAEIISDMKQACDHFHQHVQEMHDEDDEAQL